MTNMEWYTCESSASEWHSKPILWWLRCLIPGLDRIGLKYVLWFYFCGAALVTTPFFCWQRALLELGVFTIKKVKADLMVVYVTTNSSDNVLQSSIADSVIK